MQSDDPTPSTGTPDAPRWHLPATPLTDGVVTLRRHGRDDEAAVVAQSRDPEMIRWTRIPVPYDEANAREWLAGHARDEAEQSQLALAMVTAGTDEYLGTIDLRFAPDFHTAEVGFGLGAWGRGRGVVTRALRLVAGWAFDDPTGPRLAALTWAALEGNWASRRAAEKAGFRIGGVVRGIHPLRDGSLGRFWTGSLAADEPRTDGQPPL